MSSWNPFRRKSSEEQGSPASDPSEIKDPNDYGSFMQRGWAFHARGDQPKQISAGLFHFLPNLWMQTTPWV